MFGDESLDLSQVFCRHWVLDVSQIYFYFSGHVCQEMAIKCRDLLLARCLGQHVGFVHPCVT